MNAEQYEHHVAALLTAEGWRTTVSRMSGDLGVDVLAERPGRRLAVQAKMYGASSTKVNAEQVMCLYGAAAYIDCGELMLATNGRLTDDARRVAEKLSIQVRHVAAERVAGSRTSTEVPGHGLSFGELWESRVQPMKGTGVPRATGAHMRILAVDGTGIRRITSKGEPQPIAIDVFRWAIDHLLAGEVVSRQDIHDRHGGRFSSAVLDILAAIPEFEAITEGRRRAVRLRLDDAGVS
jgi:Holliday junction resolvase